MEGITAGDEGESTGQDSQYQIQMSHTMELMDSPNASDDERYLATTLAEARRRKPEQPESVWVFELVPERSSLSL